MCSAEFAACLQFSKRTGHYKLKCDEVCSVITTKKSSFTVNFLFQKVGIPLDPLGRIVVNEKFQSSVPR